MALVVQEPLYFYIRTGGKRNLRAVYLAEFSVETLIATDETLLPKIHFIFVSYSRCDVYFRNEGL